MKLKDYEPTIRSGFESTGICPLSVHRALSKLPKEDRDVAKKCSISFSSTPAPRPKKSNKWLAGASDTCSAATPTAHNRQATASGVQPSRNNADSNNSDVSDDKSLMTPVTKTPMSLIMSGTRRSATSPSGSPVIKGLGRKQRPTRSWTSPWTAMRTRSKSRSQTLSRSRKIRVFHYHCLPHVDGLGTI